MKKLILTIFAMLTIFLTSCSYQKNKINGMNVNYEKISCISSDDYGIIENDNIVLYVTANSGSYTPSVEKLTMEEETLVAEVELKIKGQYVTWDMAYWKITIYSNYDYVSRIQNVDVQVSKKSI